MLKILILCAANPANNPRPQRMISLLKNYHQVYAMGINASPIENAVVFSYPAFKKRNFFGELKLYKNVAFKNYQALIHTPNRLEISKTLQSNEFDLIICHDLVLLPIVLEHKKNAKVCFDAREFYPAQNKSNLRWRLLFAKFNDYLCKTYLKSADFIITVSKGLQNAYKKHYGINCELFYSLPKYYDIYPNIPDPKKIKIIYHGAANPNRKIHHLIKASLYLQDRFELDLMLMNTDEKYMKFLKKMVEEYQLKGKKISIIPPVSFENIIPFTSNYDIGLYGAPPTTLNLKHALPNKFFEYIQARLALVIVPNEEMLPFIKEFQNGVVAKNFSPKAIAKVINSLEHHQIKSCKEKSNEAAKILNIHLNEKNIQNIINDLFFQPSS